MGIKTKLFLIDIVIITGLISFCVALVRFGVPLLPRLMVAFIAGFAAGHLALGLQRGVIAKYQSKRLKEEVNKIVEKKKQRKK